MDTAETNLKAAVNQGLVKIEDQALLALESRRYRTQEILLRLRGFRWVCDLVLYGVLPLDERWWRWKVDLRVVGLYIGVLVLALLMHVVGGEWNVLHLNVIVNLLLLLGLICYYALLIDRRSRKHRGCEGCRVGDADLGMAGLQGTGLGRRSLFGLLSLR